MLDNVDAGFDGMAFAGTQIGLVGTRSDTLARTTDGGATWTPIAGCAHDARFVGSTVAFISCAGIHRSLDGGLTWTRVYADGGATWQLVATHAGQHAVRHTVWFNSATEGFIAAPGKATLRTTDGGLTWVVDLAARSGGLTSGAALDAQTSIVVGKRGAVMRRGP